MECRIKQHDSWFKVYFPYDEDLISAIKTIPGRRYDPVERCWLVPDSLEAKALLMQTLEPLARLVFEPSEASGAPKPAEADPFYEHLARRRYSPNTIKNYLHHAARFRDFCRTREGTCQEQVSAYFNYLVQERKASSAYQHMAVNAIQLYIKLVHNQSMPVLSMRPKREKTLPTVLSEREVQAIIQGIQNLKHRLAIALIYSAGLRISEAVNLKVSDLDFGRGVITIRQAKGRKDRQVPLAKTIIRMAREYLRQYQPPMYLFTGQSGGKYTAKSIQLVFANACRQVGICKHATVHTLRHSYATHLLEKGTDIRIIQEILGHASCKTTEIYTHVSKKTISAVVSPLDSMDLE